LLIQKLITFLDEVLYKCNLRISLEPVGFLYLRKGHSFYVKQQAPVRYLVLSATLGHRVDDVVIHRLPEVFGVVIAPISNTNELGNRVYVFVLADDWRELVEDTCNFIPTRYHPVITVLVNEKL
jgi:hypothetical protein